MTHEATQITSPPGPSEILLHLGPQHPLQPGPFLLDLKIEGETIREAELKMGYIHKGMEKVFEDRTYIQILPLTDRICYLASNANNDVYCRAVEELLGIEPTDRAKYLRVIANELNRIQSHLLGIGEYTTDVGFLTMFIYMVRERESVVSLLEAITGSRLNHNYARFGGVAHDLPPDYKRMAIKSLGEVGRLVRSHDEMLSTDSVYRSRTKGVGVLTAKQASELGVAGPPLRASGVEYDLRRIDPYLVYDDLDFKVITQTDGDVFSRVKVRLLEIQESIYIIEQCLDQMPSGPYKQHITPYITRPKAGEVYTRIEDPRGEMGMYLVSDGSNKPYRFRIRGPAFATAQALPPLLVGTYMADVAAIAASMDSCTSEVDR
jgi:NADH:ubiquinone oxidoreductase subunit D